jgi:hypothetical protein
MPRPRKNADPDTELRVTLDGALAGPLRTAMKPYGFANETEFVRHMVRTWLSHHGQLPPLGLADGDKEQHKDHS